MKIIKSIKTLMAEDYHPEMDDGNFLSADDGARYRSVIGSLNWVVTLSLIHI